MSIYSHSKLSTFEQCKYKYKLKYIDKIPSPIEKSIEAHLGTCVHDALEWLYNQIIEGKIPELEEVLKKYLNKWEEGWTDSISIVRQEITKEEYKNKGIKFLIDYYIKNKPFKDGTISTEERVLIELNKNFPHKIIGYIDRLSYNKEKEEFEIHDYKTANTLPEKEKFEKDRQLALYSLAIKEKYGQDKSIILIWHYLNYNIEIFSKRTNEELKNLKHEIIELINEIENTEEFPTNISTLCNWCEYKKYCKAFGNKIPDKFKKTKI